MSSPSSTHLIGMHGWAGDQRSWMPWAELAQQRGWGFSCGERGYGGLEPQDPHWPASSQRRIVIAHSLGPHLMAEAIWQQATGTVLLASFGRFVPAGRAGRPLQMALRSMRQRLEAGEAAPLLREFLARAAEPQSADLLPSGPLEQGISAKGLERLLADLQRLEVSRGLPPGFPAQGPVLIVEAAQDQIVAPESRAALRAELPAASVWTREGLGHSLLDPSLPKDVLSWIDAACD
ncbi:MAG: hypothetical protein RLZZ32_1524 [Cyanobacteriota bacterium]